MQPRRNGKSENHPHPPTCPHMDVGSCWGLWGYFEFGCLIGGDSAGSGTCSLLRLASPWVRKAVRPGGWERPADSWTLLGHFLDTVRGRGRGERARGAEKISKGKYEMPATGPPECRSGNQNSPHSPHLCSDSSIFTGISRVGGGFDSPHTLAPTPPSTGGGRLGQQVGEFKKRFCADSPLFPGQLPSLGGGVGEIVVFSLSLSILQHGPFPFSITEILERRLPPGQLEMGRLDVQRGGWIVHLRTPCGRENRTRSGWAFINLESN